MANQLSSILLMVVNSTGIVGMLELNPCGPCRLGDHQRMLFLNASTVMVLCVLNFRYRLFVYHVSFEVWSESLKQELLFVYGRYICCLYACLNAYFVFALHRQLRYLLNDPMLVVLDFASVAVLLSHKERCGVSGLGYNCCLHV